MPIAETDLLAFCSANMPEDDSSSNGGAIDADQRVVFTDLAASDDVEALSSAGGDTTQNVTVYGRKADGTYVNETKTLTGVTPVIFSTIGVLERIEKVTMDADAAGVVTIQRSVAGAVIGTIPIGERGFRRLFINAISDPSSPKPYYMKIFLKNAHATLALLAAVVKQSADPTTKVTHLIGSAVNGATTSANRLTAPAAGDTLDPDVFDDNDKNVPGTDLAAGSAIAVWLKLSLAAAEPPIKSTYTAALSGGTA